MAVLFPVWHLVGVGQGFHVGRMLPMGRILRVEPFCFARKAESLMVAL